MSRRRLVPGLLLGAVSLALLALLGGWLAIRARPGPGTPGASVEAPADPVADPDETQAQTPREAEARGSSSAAGDESASDRGTDPAIAGACTIRGVVVTGEGAPVAGAGVYLRGRVHALTDSGGRFEIGGLVEGFCDLEIAARGFGRRRIARAPASENPEEEDILRIVLRPELLLRGEVVDEKGAAIPDAEVALEYLAADASDLESIHLESSFHGSASARTNSEGRFTIGGLDRGVYRAEASAEHHATGRAPLVEVHERNDPDESFLAFELEASRHIRGIVRSPNGAPVAEARVNVLSRAIRGISTDSRGAFLLDGLPADTCRLVVSATAHRERTLEVVPDGKPLEVVLEHRLPLVGLVIDRSSGGSVAEAELLLRARPGREDYELLARADGEGRFVISSYPEDVSAVFVEAWGYSGGEVAVPDPPPAEGWVIELERCGSVSGRVLAPAKLPVRGVKVWLARDETEGTREAARERSARVLGNVQYMEEGGFFRLFVAEAGTYRVLVDGASFAPAVSEPIFVPDAQAEIQGISIALELAGGAQGFVFSRDLGRVAGARVLAFPEGDETSFWLQRRRETMADAAGSFAIAGLRPGAYRLVAGAPGFASTPSEPFLVQGGGTPTVHLELEPEMTISGRVVDATGLPIPLAEVHAAASGDDAGEPWREERSKSSVFGTFRLSRLAAGRYDLRFEAEGFGPILITAVDAGRDDIEARLERLVPLSGKVSGAFTGDPVPVFKLRIRLDDEGRLYAADREPLQAWREFNDPAGAFRIDDIPPGRYLVDAEAPLHLGLQALELEVLTGEGLADADVRLQESGLIAGAVIDAHGMAVSGARVEALERRIDPERGTISYEAVRVPAPKRAAAEPSGGSGGPRREGGGERRGRGRGGEGRDRETMPAVATTREDGSFLIRGLPDGMYRLSIAHDDHLPRELGDLVFESGLCANPALASGILLASGVALRGRMRGLAEAEGGRISISLRPVPGPDDPRGRRISGSKTAQVDASGHFEIRGLATGNYILYARYRRAADSSFASIRRDVNIHGAGREQGILLDLGK